MNLQLKVGVTQRRARTRTVLWWFDGRTPGGPCIGTCFFTQPGGGNVAQWSWFQLRAASSFSFWRVFRSSAQQWQQQQQQRLMSATSCSKATASWRVRYCGVRVALTLPRRKTAPTLLSRPDHQRIPGRGPGRLVNQACCDPARLMRLRLCASLSLLMCCHLLRAETAEHLR
jgi:hypothetical protein